MIWRGGVYKVTEDVKVCVSLWDELKSKEDVLYSQITGIKHLYCVLLQSCIGHVNIFRDPAR